MADRRGRGSGLQDWTGLLDWGWDVFQHISHPLPAIPIPSHTHPPIQYSCPILYSCPAVGTGNQDLIPSTTPILPIVIEIISRNRIPSSVGDRRGDPVADGGRAHLPTNVRRSHIFRDRRTDRALDARGGARMA